MKKLYIDVMVLGGAKFYCTLVYTYNPLFKVNPADVEKYVIEKRPTLKHRKDVVLVIDEKRSV